MHIDADMRDYLTPDAELVAVAVELFGMLADPTRVRIVLALATSGELSVNRVAEMVEKTPSAASQHLAKLRIARMVTTRQDGTRVFYKLADEHPVDLVIGALKQAEHTVAGEVAPRHHSVERETATRESAS